MQHTKERQAAGIKVARKKSIYAGRKADPKRARAFRQQGMTDREIAKALGIGVSTVYRYLAASKKKR
ncbi:MAG TPA: helix-turn-helix domain-containing protein [Nitrospirales bacterium]|nr:helix-turn-helix domain-containing protein [Nitrospirales bacterium]